MGLYCGAAPKPEGNWNFHNVYVSVIKLLTADIPYERAPALSYVYW